MRVDAIRGEPSPHGLLGSCVEVIDSADGHEFNGTDMVPLSCAQAHDRTWCPDPVAAKIFDRPESCSFPPIAIYSGSTCGTFGMSQAEAEQHATEQLRMGEQRALEEWYQREQLCTMAAGNDLTPVAGALHIAQAVGVLESWLATNYGGQGLIHVPAGAAALLSMHTIIDFATEETCPTTLMGNGVILGAGYAANVGPATPPATGCVTAPAGEVFLYATPPVRVRRSPVQVLPGSERYSINTSTNDRTVLAERAFVVESACCTAATVRASLAACP
jgi:hypothetical protein